jgi:hypothetical protein
MIGVVMGGYAAHYNPNYFINTMQRNRAANWIGPVVFIILVLGSRIFPPLSAWLTQVTGVPISTGALYAGAVILGIVGPALVSAIGAARQRLPTGETRLPTQLPPPMVPGQPPVPVERLPEWMRPSKAPQMGPPPSINMPAWMKPNLPSGQPPRLGKPQFEPMIDPRVVTISLFGIGGFVLLFALLVALS